MSRLLTTKEIAEYLKLTEVTIRRKSARGQIPSFRVGGQLRFEKKEIDKWLRQSANGRQASILVVDDDPLILSLFRDCLRGKNYQVTTTLSSHEALELVSKNRFDLVFIDLVMPEMNGSILFQKITELDENIPIAIITGYPDSDLMKEVMKQGPFLVINKPFSGDDIIRAVRTFSRNSGVKK